MKEEEGEGDEGGCFAGEPVLGVVVSQWRHYPTLALGANCCELLSAKLFARRADKGPRVEPVILNQPHLNFLPRVETGESVVEHLHVQPLLLAGEVVAAAPPMLPLTHLAATSLLPHPLSVVKTSSSWTVGLQSKVSFVTWLVFFIHAMASSYNNIVASPGELLNIRAVVGKSHAPSIMADVLRSHMWDCVKILERWW